MSPAVRVHDVVPSPLQCARGSVYRLLGQVTLQDPANPTNRVQKHAASPRLPVLRSRVSQPEVDDAQLLLQRRSMNRNIRIVASVALVIGIFFFALPKIADISEVGEVIAAMTPVEIGTLFLAAAWNIFTYWFVMMAALPGSNIWQTMKINQASTAIANTVPGGGAIGIGVTYSMYSSYGFTGGQIGLSVLVSGIWNNFVKLGMPVVALALLAIQGEVSGSLALAGVVGTLTLLVAIGLFAAVLSSDRLAARVGRFLSRVVGRLRRLVRKDPTNDIENATVRFRRDAITLVRKRWLYLTVSTVISHLSLFFVLLLALRHGEVAGTQVTWTEALAAFAFVRLISALPLTPGGLGVVELGLTAALITAGGPRPEVVAAILVYRALTYLLPIPFGLALYLKWKAGAKARAERVAAAGQVPAVEEVGR